MTAPVHPLQQLCETFKSENNLYLISDEGKENKKLGRFCQFYFELSEKTFGALPRSDQDIAIFVVEIGFHQYYGDRHIANLYNDHFYVPIVKTNLPFGKAILRKRFYEKCQ